jgi:hypothetical protein
MIERGAPRSGRLQGGFADIDRQQSATMGRKLLRQNALRASDFETQFISPTTQSADAMGIFIPFVAAAFQIPGIVGATKYIFEILWFEARLVPGQNALLI